MTQEPQTELIFLCFHYLKHKIPFEEIHGYSWDNFKKYIDFLIKEYPPISFKQLNNYLNNQEKLPEKCSLISFDDGLKEHGTVIADYLNSRDIKAIFAVPTCIFENKMAPPQVVHLAIAKYGVRNFYALLKKHFSRTGLAFFDYFQKEHEDLPEEQFYQTFKRILLHYLPHQATLATLDAVFEKELAKDCPDILKEIYLNSKELSNLYNSGHTIACHTASHYSFLNHFPSKVEWQTEVTNSKRILEDIIGEKVEVFSYPYGAYRDNFNFDLWTKQLKQEGFTYGLNARRNLVKKITFNPFWIERYSVGSCDTIDQIRLNVLKYKI